MRHYAISLLALLFVAAPANAQFLKKLEQEFAQSQTGQGALGGLGSLLPGQGGSQSAGTTSLPAGQYTMTNMQTGQAYYVMVNTSGQMFASVAPGGGGMMQPNAQQYMNPQQLQQQQMLQQQQQGGMGGMMKGGLGNFLKQELAPKQPQQY